MKTALVCIWEWTRNVWVKKWCSAYNTYSPTLGISNIVLTTWQLSPWFAATQWFIPRRGAKKTLKRPLIRILNPAPPPLAYHKGHRFGGDLIVLLVGEVNTHPKRATFRQANSCDFFLIERTSQMSRRLCRDFLTNISYYWSPCFLF